MTFLSAIKNYISSLELFDTDDRILVAVSGGIDSTVLLDVLVKLNYKVAIAHCNFGLRGGESDSDEDFVKGLQHKYGIKGFYIHFDTKTEADKAGESIQMAARRLRYRWFNELCNHENYRYVAIAHNADDTAETFLLNLTRGTGIKGLTGIKPKTGRIVRPLLFAARHSIATYSNDNQLEFREDSSNRVDKYARNRIRLNIIPEFKQINPAFDQTMLGNITRLQLVESIVTKEVNNFKREYVEHLGTEIQIRIEHLMSNPYAELLLFEVLNEYGFSGFQVESIFRSLQTNSSGKLFQSHRYTLLRDRDRLLLYPTMTKVDSSYNVYEDTLMITSPIKVTFNYLKKDSEYQLVRSSKVAHIDAAKLQFPLTIRRWHWGDEFKPLGMTGRKKLSDFFIDQKLSLLDKDNQWLLCSGDKVVWVIGRRLDDRFKVTDATSEVLEVVLEQ